MRRALGPQAWCDLLVAGWMRAYIQFIGLLHFGLEYVLI